MDNYPIGYTTVLEKSIRLTISDEPCMGSISFYFSIFPQKYKWCHEFACLWLGMSETLRENSARDCPFRDGNCIGRECMLWIGKFDEETKEHVGHCVLVKSFTEIDTKLSCIIIALIVLILMILFLPP